MEHEIQSVHCVLVRAVRVLEQAAARSGANSSIWRHGFRDRARKQQDILLGALEVRETWAGSMTSTRTAHGARLSACGCETRVR